MRIPLGRREAVGVPVRRCSPIKVVFPSSPTHRPAAEDDPFLPSAQRAVNTLLARKNPFAESPHRQEKVTTKGCRLRLRAGLQRPESQAPARPASQQESKGRQTRRGKNAKVGKRRKQYDRNYLNLGIGSHISPHQRGTTPPATAVTVMLSPPQAAVAVAKHLPSARDPTPR